MAASRTPWRTLGPRSLLAGLLVTTLVAMIWTLAERRSASMEEARRYTVAKAELVSSWVSSHFALSSHVLSGTGMLALESLAADTSTPLVHLASRLDKRASAVEFVDALALLSPQGEPLVLSSNDGDLTGLLRHHTRLVEDFLASARQSQVSGLLHHPESTGLQALHFRALHADDGELQGIMVAQLNLAALNDTIAQAAQLEGESLALVDLDLHLVTRHPLPTAEGAGIGLPFELEPLSRAVREGQVPNGLVVRSPLDQEVRLLSGERLEDAPYLVVIGWRSADILAPWWRELGILLGGWLVTALLGSLALRRHLSALVGKQQLIEEVQHRRSAQGEIQQREDELRTLVTGIEALLFRFDQQGHLEFAHAHRPDLLIAPMKQLIGRHYSEILPGDIAERFTSAMEEIETSGLPAEIAYRLQLDGSYRDFKAIMRPLMNDTLKPAGFVTLVTDVTREKALEAQLRIAAMAFDTHLGMFITDASGKVIKTNGTFTRITGYTESEVIGRNPRMWSSGRHDAAFYRDMWHAIEKDGSWQGEIWNRHKHGDLYPQWLTISAIRNESNELLHYVATLSDLSEAKEAEDVIHRLAFYDPLTGLPNRQRLLNTLRHFNERPTPDKGYSALLLAGLDNFKAFNSTLGHKQGDVLLQKIAESVNGFLEDGDVLARWGGDQFALLSRDLGVKLKSCVWREVERVAYPAD